jgi:nitric oxide reductase NorD protein
MSGVDLHAAVSEARGFDDAAPTFAEAEADEVEADEASAAPPATARMSLAARRSQLRGVQSFLYDEWDHVSASYLPQHCRVHELPLVPDSGAFFERTLREARGLLTQVRRQFEQMRPERYRPLFGLEDGEDFDLNALTDARIAARAGRTDRTRIYTSRTREARDVATLFLLDMSASTEERYAEPAKRRIIDTLKEALIIMTAALEKLGDQYAIYGFSSRGRDQVDVYPVKTFAEPLDHAVKARLGGIEPKSGTRMGAALRHMLPKFSAVNARAKHLILLSDGYPQDHDYGQDPRTHSYGIADTAVALRELSAAGPVPFCITVDRTGNDYLRLMCDPSQYLIIHDVAQLPRELPKIYRRVARE